MNIIEQLKDNEKPFGRMSEEMQEKAKDIGKNNNFQRWVCLNNWSTAGDDVFIVGSTYRLRDDYEEEPEIEEVGIRNVAGDLIYKYGGVGRRYLDMVFRDPDFIGFKKDGWIWGRLYRNKKGPSIVHCMIKEHDLLLYDVISMVDGKVLFRRAK